MSNLFWLSDAQMARFEPFFPKSHGKPRVDDLRALSGIIFVNRHGLRWCDAPREYGPPKTLYNRWKRWSGMGVFTRIMTGLAAEAADERTIMIDATYLQAHRTASSLRVKKGEEADWREVARIVLHRDPAVDKTRTRRCWESHLARAQWLTNQGYRKILEQACAGNGAARRNNASLPPSLMRSASKNYSLKA